MHNGRFQYTDNKSSFSLLSKVRTILNLRQLVLVFLRSSIFGANEVGLLLVAAFVAMIFILTNYLQRQCDYSSFSSGLAFLPIGVVLLIDSAFLSTRFVNHFGVKPILILGMALQTAMHSSSTLDKL